MKINVNPAKGMRDLLPKEKEIRDHVEKMIIDTYKNNGFQLIETPVVENIDNLLGSKGGENLKLIFKIMKRGNKLNLTKENLKESDLAELGLRYDLTIPLSRFYCNHRNELPSVFKAIQVGNVFRAERAQKGRYRSFKQCDIDIIGNPGCDAEIELLTSTAKALTELKVNDFQIRINDRRILKSVVISCGFNEDDFEIVCIILDKLDKIGIEGIKKELSVKDFPSESIDKILSMLDEISQGDMDVLNKYGVPEEIIENMDCITRNVRAIADGKYDIVFDFTLVRGMGYYTGPIFEIAYKGLGYSIAGGGRYDEMIGGFIGEKIPAVGFSIGFERLVNQMIEDNYKSPGNEKIVLLYDKEEEISNVIKKAEELRTNGYSVSLFKKAKKVGKQLNQLASQGFDKFAMYSQDTLEIKNLD
jgi:histidyl-tRNA synthetase